MEYTVSDLKKRFNPQRILGNYEGRISRVMSLDKAQAGDLTFLGLATNRSDKYRALVSQSAASIILVPLDYSGEPGPNQMYFFLTDPRQAMSRLFAEMAHQGADEPQGGIHPTAIVDKSAKVAPTAQIGPFVVLGAGTEIGERTILDAGCVVGKDCKLGADCHLFPRVTLYAGCELGDRIWIHSGAVIGSDGFGYVSNESGDNEKIFHFGKVILEDDVEIGANTTIDRASFDCTRIGRGTKIDNLVQIGHNVQVGTNCFLVSQCGIAGSATIGNRVIIAGQAGVAGHITLGDGSQLGAQSGISKDLDPGERVRGTPALPIFQANRFYILRKQLPALFRRVEDLERNQSEK